VLISAGAPCALWRTWRSAPSPCCSAAARDNDADAEGEKATTSRAMRRLWSAPDARIMPPRTMRTPVRGQQATGTTSPGLIPFASLSSVPFGGHVTAGRPRETSPVLGSK